MKKIAFLTITTLFLIISSLKAQDLIVKTDGTIIKGKISEISDEAIKYKKADNLDGPVYSVSKSSVSAINYENGTVEKFEAPAQAAKEKNEDEEYAEKEEPTKKNPILEDEQMKKTVEAIAKDVGEQLLSSCANGKIDNSTTSIFWDGVFKDAITGELNVPIITTWKPKWTDGSGKWIKGKIVITSDGNKRWIYQNDNGLMFPSCAKQFRIR